MGWPTKCAYCGVHSRNPCDLRHERKRDQLFEAAHCPNADPWDQRKAANDLAELAMSGDEE